MSDNDIIVELRDGVEDTHVDVDDGGSAVSDNVDYIDFTTNINVTDDGDGVKVDAAGTSIAVSDDGTEVLAAPDDVNFSSLLTATDDNDNTVTVDVDESNISHDEIDQNTVDSDDHHTKYTDGEARGASLFDANRWNPPSVELDAGEGVRTSVIVPDTKTLNVYKWGAYDITTGGTPANLDVQLLDAAGGTVQASATTKNTEDESTPVASYQNNTGSEQVFVLRIDNATGGTVETDTEGFIYRVE